MLMKILSNAAYQQYDSNYLIVFSYILKWAKSLD